MKRRNFLSLLGIAPIAAKLGWIKPAAAEPALAVSKDAFAMVAADLPMPPLFAIGDIVSFGGVYARNPMTREVTKHPLHFVITHHVEGKMQLMPVPRTEGFYANCNKQPFGMPTMMMPPLDRVHHWNRHE